MELSVNNSLEKNKKFLELISEGFSKADAARMAGFSTPSRDAYPLLMTEEAAQYIKRRIQLRIRSEIVPEAMEIALSIMRNPKTSDRTRWSIIQTLLAYGADIVAPKAGEGEDGKAPEAMKSEELREFIAMAEGELARRVKPARLADARGEVIDLQAEEVDIFS